MKTIVSKCIQFSMMGLVVFSQTNALAGKFGIVGALKKVQALTLRSSPTGADSRTRSGSSESTGSTPRSPSGSIEGTLPLEMSLAAFVSDVAFEVIDDGRFFECAHLLKEYEANQKNSDRIKRSGRVAIATTYTNAEYYHVKGIALALNKSWSSRLSEENEVQSCAKDIASGKLFPLGAGFNFVSPFGEFGDDASVSQASAKAFPCVAFEAYGSPGFSRSLSTSGR